jgi:hypothetical protein
VNYEWNLERAIKKGELTRIKYIFIKLAQWRVFFTYILFFPGLLTDDAVFFRIRHGIGYRDISIRLMIVFHHRVVGFQEFSGLREDYDLNSQSIPILPCRGADGWEFCFWVRLLYNTDSEQKGLN